MTPKNNPQEACEQAHKAYVDAFTHQALYKMKDKLPRKQWKEMMGQLMDRTPEWKAYQEAWMLAYGEQQVLGKVNDRLRQTAQRANAKAIDLLRSKKRMEALEKKKI